jgi:hypothetical protein
MIDTTPKEKVVVVFGNDSVFIMTHEANTGVSLTTKAAIEVAKNLQKKLTPCEHKNTAINTTGGFHFSGGEVWDDLEDTVICLDCGETIG